MALKPELITASGLPLIIAHRGSSSRAPENTRAAFRLAVADGADGIELDVRLSLDEKAVVFHDATLERTARRNGLIAELTSKQLAEIDVGSWFNEVFPERSDAPFSSERVPTLSEVLEILDGFSGLVYVELKCSDGEIGSLTTAVAEAVRHSPLRDQIIVKSFQLAVIPNLRYTCPGIATAALFAPKIMRYLRKEKYLVDIARAFGADQLSLHYSMVTRKLMKKVEKHRLPVSIWTADHPRWVKRAARLGVNAIITNDPARLIAARSEFESNQR